jgi:predicted nuclease of predicted toxin-antitoxin system
MKLLIDMNLAPRWVNFLTAAGWEAIHWSSIGKATAADSEIMLHAAERGYAVVTFDMDFSDDPGCHTWRKAWRCPDLL